MNAATTSSNRPATRTRAELERRADNLRRLVREHLTANPDEARRAVVRRMHWNGDLHRYVAPELWRRAYLLCDGFGPGLTADEAEAQCWDWSHVRDSSDGALVAAAVALVCTDESLGLAD